MSDRNKTLTDLEEQILNGFAKILPTLTERQKERLYWIAEGMSIRADGESMIPAVVS